MKVILNKDLASLGEEGDIKDVAKGYARNYLFPRGIALPYNERTIKLFEVRKEEIEVRKAQKRQDATGIKEKLEALSLTLVMPAGANGRLYGAVTAHTVADELAKQGFQVERKKIEIPGNTIKSVGKYKITIKLYENAAAECPLTVEGQPVKTETKVSSAPQRGRRRASFSEGEGRRSFSENSAETQSPPKEPVAGEQAGGVTETQGAKDPVGDNSAQSAE